MKTYTFQYFGRTYESVVPKATVMSRLRDGWTLQRAITERKATLRERGQRAKLNAFRSLY
jgi:hypothetical protein